MPGPDLAQYGIAFFAVAGLIYIISRWLGRDEINLVEVVQNNTKACIGVRGGESRPEALFLCPGAGVRCPGRLI